MFHPLVKDCRILRNGITGKRTFTRRIGALTSKKPLTALEMPSNTLEDTPIRSPFPTAVSFLWQKTKSHSLPEGKSPASPNARSLWSIQNSSIRRYLMHVLPPGFQKIRYYGFLNNRMKRKNLKLIFTLQGHQRFKRRFTEMSMAELLKAVWDFDISICPECGHRSMKQLGRCYATSWSSWLLILFWKSLPTGGFKSMPCNVLHHENLRVFSRSPGKSDNLNHLGTIQSPYTHRLNVRELAQLWRITFRAVRVSYRTALFVCSKYDTSLMNHITDFLCSDFFLILFCSLRESSFQFLTQFEIW